MGSRTLAYTGDWQKWTVPRGVKLVRATIDGAGSTGVPGGRVTGTITVKAGQVLHVLVGQAGRPATVTTRPVPGAATVGGGGEGGYGRTAAGASGGGASQVRLNGPAGPLIAVAAGAGGRSGDGGTGGQGGANAGENGFPGSAGVTLPILARQGNATGGTQLQGGNGGRSGVDALYDGHSPSDGVLVGGGPGGGVATTEFDAINGGGGGGGGYHPGGGGQAGVVGLSAAGGGGGGANYRGGLGDYSTSRGSGSLTNGLVVLSWTDPAPANQPPSPPTEVKIGGVDYVGDEHVTRSTNQLSITAKVDDPKAGQTVRLVVVYGTNATLTEGVKTVNGNLVAQTKRSTVTLTGLRQDTRYWARLYTRDSRGLQSINYTSVNFWTNRMPTEPTLTFPSENSTVSELDSTVFQWDHNDPDPDGQQKAFDLRWRTSGTVVTPPGPWTTVSFTTWFNQYVVDPGTFKANSFYEWTVRTTDTEGATGPWAIPSSFYVSGAALHPLLLSPVLDVAVDVSVAQIFQWKFRDPDQGDAQHRADIRWRPVGTQEWMTRIGTTLDPGGIPSWVVAANTFLRGIRYEWQVRTEDTLATAVSAWSASGTFWGIGAPGGAVLDIPLIPSTRSVSTALGCGHNRVYAYTKGGRHYMGEITPLAAQSWGRTRDDISTCLITTAGFGPDCGDMLRELHSWMHELVVFRDGKRVWEGPISRIQDSPTGLVIEAKDVMNWPYRRIMRQGYNDAFRIVNGIELGTATAVQRAKTILLNALARDDPNIIDFMTTFEFPDDAGQSRVVPDFSKTAWEEVDDLAATGGIDYTVAGRRIMIYDTHRPLGRLAELRTENFSVAPVITEYGMQLATTYGVTNNSGIYGVVDRDPLGYGPVELLASAYGETEGGTEEVLTSAARLALEEVLRSQAQRGIASRYPAPLMVRVPDGATLTPETEVDINHLIPGVWVPLRARGTLREIAQWQKLDALTVTETPSEGEKVSVTFSPAPNGGQDPDAEGAIAEAAEG